MRPPLIRRPGRSAGLRSKERGATMALVALALVTIIAMAALSIDIGTLYEAKAEAQRAADAAALAGARTISISGITGDPGNISASWQTICGGTSSLATLAATTIAQQNLIAGVSVPTTSITVTYGAGSAGGTALDCSTLGSAFGVNPIVTVSVQRTNLQIFFARIFTLFGRNFSGGSVSASASAEVFNSSNSGSVASSGMIPVQPRCVKPWIIPNVDPGNSSANFVSPTDGSILHPGISPIGVIGESFNINADCVYPGTLGTCTLISPIPGYAGGFLQYVPALAQSNSGAVPSCLVPITNNFQKAIVGCDQTTVYACGTPLGAQVDLTENPVNSNPLDGDTGTAVQCLTNAAPLYGGADQLAPGAPPFAYPFQIQAGLGNPLVAQGVVNNNDIITTSPSIVTIPIFDTASLAGANTQPPVTIVGFLQVFINGFIGPNNNVSVTVMNVAGCSNNATNAPVTGTSPVPVRLITPP